MYMETNTWSNLISIFLALQKIMKKKKQFLQRTNTNIKW